MTPELIAIIAVACALAGLIITTTRSLREEITAVRKELGGEIAEVRKELGEEIAEVRKDVGEVRKELSEMKARMAHLDGLLEGLREAITYNRRAA